jgi:hypothetical protein
LYHSEFYWLTWLPIYQTTGLAYTFLLYKECPTEYIWVTCTVKPAHVVTSIKQSLVLKGHLFLVLYMSLICILLDILYKGEKCMQVLYTSIEDNFHLFESKKIFFLLLSAFVKNLSLTRFIIHWTFHLKGSCIFQVPITIISEIMKWYFFQ